MKIHFIAIGGSAMHNLALTLHLKGYHITGSDDEIFEPSKSRLQRAGLLPDSEGWNAAKITSDLDAVILGMHAKPDNPELLRAKELGLKVYSYPEYLYEHSKNKHRIVVGGSHGKTTITAMILHVMKEAGMECDYIVGAQLIGFDVMVKLTDKARYMVFEGDEYLTSPDDRRPKFHLYLPHIALLSGIAWDHINVFPTFDNYVEQFRIFIEKIIPGGTLIFYEEDPVLKQLAFDTRDDIEAIPYSAPDYFIRQGTSVVVLNGKEYPMRIFGRHNMTNLSGAVNVCRLLGISREFSLQSLTQFPGASRRLEKIVDSEHFTLFRDFAHAPSKVQATIEAVREQYPERKLIACLELHTYSSLSDHFLSHYYGTMNLADCASVYYNPHALQLKRLPPIDEHAIRVGFGRKDLEVFSESERLKDWLASQPHENSLFLMMSSGDFDGLNLSEI